MRILFGLFLFSCCCCCLLFFSRFTDEIHGKIPITFYYMNYWINIIFCLSSWNFCVSITKSFCDLSWQWLSWWISAIFKSKEHLKMTVIWQYYTLNLHLPLYGFWFFTIWRSFDVLLLYFCCIFCAVFPVSGFCSVCQSVS